MNDEALRRQLRRVQGDEPSPEFVDGLRGRLLGEDSMSWTAPRTAEEDVTVIELDHDIERDSGQGRRPRVLWAVAAAAALLVGIPLLARAVTGGEPNLETATTSQAQRTGEAWLSSIVDDDRDAFTALHANGFEADDTLMGFAEDTGVLTPTRVAELYFDGFDALQAAIETDGDLIRSNGCQDTEDRTVRCSFTATMIGPESYSYTLTAELIVEDRLITSIDFSTTTDPADFRSLIQEFLEEEATEEDRSCLLLGFNTVGCGEYESDFVGRYAAYYEAAQESSGG